MADTNHNRRADVPDDDPFAELTRIMGHDPRPRQEPTLSAQPAQAFEDDFDIDLEQELMGEFDFSEFDAPASGEPEPASQWRDAEQQDAPVAGVEPQQSEDLYHAAGPADAHAPEELQPEFDSGHLSFEGEDFGAALERELFVAEEDEPPHEIAAAAAPAGEPAAAYEPASDHDEPVVGHVEPSFEAAAEEPVAYEPAAVHDEPAQTYQPEPAEPVLDDFESAEPGFEDIEAAEPEAFAGAPVSYSEDPFEEAAPQVVAGDPIDFELVRLEEELARETADVPSDAAGYGQDDLAGAPAAEPAEAFDEPAEAFAEPEAYGAEQPAAWDPSELDSYEPVKQPAFAASRPEPAALSLEDELAALLAESASATLRPQAAAEAPAWEPEAAPAAPTGWEPESAVVPLSAWEPEEPAAPAQAWQPAVNTFGRANFSAKPAHADYGMQPEAFAGPAEAEVTQEEPADAFEESEPAPTPSEDDFTNIFGDDFVLELEEEQPAQEPEPLPQQPAAAATAATAAGIGALASWMPQRAQPAPAPAPEVETIEMIEAAQPVTDDLDIPDVDYGSPAPRALDDLENEFSQAFGELSLADQPETASYSPAAAIGGAAAPQEFAADAYALGEGEWQAADQHGDAGFDYESDLEQEIGMSAFEDEPVEEPARGGRRGLLVAALVASVAVIGGVGVFGMSFFGGGSDGPALVRADSDPMKVRPENPGGATVPNQDSQVYQRVGGGAEEAAPGQERLITSAEEPVDVTARAEPPALPPGVSEEGAEDDILAAAEAEGEPKVEDRLEPTETAAALDGPGEVGAVAPRRVRTMVVRPDGTMVPREEVEQAAPAPATSAPEAMAAAPSGPAAATGAAPADETVLAAVPPLAAPALGPANMVPLPDAASGEEAAAAEDEDGGPVVVTPQTVNVVPTQRTQPPAAAAPAAPAAQMPAATPVSAPAAAAPAIAGATSEWSMQIASQPTAEGAQATYQDLARRYGGVLEGRGVNIVRADIEGMGTYYRVRIPASSRDEAIQLCTRYKSAGGSCFVSR